MTKPEPTVKKEHSLRHLSLTFKVNKDCLAEYFQSVGINIYNNHYVLLYPEQYERTKRHFRIRGSLYDSFKYGKLIFKVYLFRRSGNEGVYRIVCDDYVIKDIDTEKLLTGKIESFRYHNRLFFIIMNEDELSITCALEQKS